MPNQEVMSPEQIAEEEAIAQRMAERAGENTNTFILMPTITVFNKTNADNPKNFALGDILKSVKTDQGWQSEKYEKPFLGIILKVRMFLKLKYKYAEGKPGIITNEFDSYSEDEIITVKKQDENGVYQPEFMGNYTQVNDKYSLKSDTLIEKMLDLHHAIYILRDFSSKEMVRLDCKGLSRSDFFDYMKSFTRVKGDFMSAHWTNFDTEISDTDFRGKTRQTPIAAFKFSKGEKLDILELKQAEEIQIEFDRQIKERDKAFGVSSKDIAEVEEPKEELPTINLDDEEPPQLEEGKEEEVKIEDVPF